MLSLAKMSMGQDGYYADLAQTDYYLSGGEPPGIWEGQAAKEFGLFGQVDNKIFRELFSGFLDGKQMVQNAGKPERCPGWDLCFSAPKTVSTLWSQLDQASGLEIRAAHHEAVTKALAYIEGECGYTRRGKAGSIKEKAKLAFAVFEHGTSRAGDPQLHSHALLLNLALREDGTTGTLDTRKLFYHKMTAGALYRAELAYQLEKRLGLELIRDKFSFEVIGVSGDLADEFSKRRQEIESRLELLGLRGAAVSEKVALQSRENKAMKPREELQKIWRETALTFQWSLEKAQALIKEGGMGREGVDLDLAKKWCLQQATEKVVENTATFAERDLIRFFAEESQTRGLSADDAIATSREALSQSKKLVNLGLLVDEHRYSTQEIIELEKDLIKKARHLAARESVSVSQDILNEVIAERPTIKEEQAKAVEAITTGPTGRVTVVTGDAGTGKTFMLDAARAVLEKAGYEVIGAALSGIAAQMLEDGAGIASRTIHRLLFDLDRDPSGLNESTVLVVDEAGMVDTRRMHHLVRVCEESGASLVLVGDAKQLQSVEIGGAFQAITEEVGSSQLREIIRQRDVEDRKAIRNISTGNPKSALLHYAEKGALAITETRTDAMKLLINQWEIGGCSSPEDHLILASQNHDVSLLNQVAQIRRLEAGELGDKRRLNVGENCFYENDRILFTRNHSGLGIKNGHLGTIRLIDPILETLSVILDDGGERVIATGSYDHLRLGYAVTTHKAQGVTVDQSYILTDEMMQDKELSYVQVSRARGETRIYTTAEEAGADVVDLAKRMERSREKELAIDEAKRTEPVIEPDYSPELQ